jgi:hypothetical protein
MFLQNGAPMETRLFPEPYLAYLLGSARSPHRAPTDRDAPFPEPYLAYLSGSARSPHRAPTETLRFQRLTWPIFRGPHVHLIELPQRRSVSSALLHSPFKLPGIRATFQFPLH